ncbi:PepSY-associated TM helix domain-containing protein [Mitsuaria sp. GD03876]|uniref:PepSY-associated TM helix domain-containing protein n=1 Tax=Mitsuaria sp. GD03876 TaxID=2975399 RepID=UPI00244B54A2|nr:PepSY-associated TM helix domain-containing protein [Mitsuaria sp. GD03876]MDH0865503.1 PepSY-associated TM helix domain-containing protein [Mitsuaria sp. GD03876]
MSAAPHTGGDAARKPAQRAAWLKQLHQWHWISSAICLIGMILFAVTGITLNHAASIEATPAIVSKTAQLPEALAASLKPAAGSEADRKAAVPAPVRAWLAQALDRPVDGRDAEWTRDEIYLALPRPGGDAWIRIARDSGEVEYEDTDRGWISYLNDLHKGRNAGTAWSWFIDVFAAACLVFSITGLLILKFHAVARPSTWPLVGLGLVIPALLALLLIH